tara:strand:- start:39231 stop:40646 length:1416 start_codon:yes stop_codon:yes gene_type:complete
MITYSNTYNSLPEHFFTQQFSDKFLNPSLIAFNHLLAKELFGDDLSSHSAHELAKYFSGQERHRGFEPLAMAYSGHQFGHFNPTLGDGRALLLGEVVTDQQRRFDIQLKGSGQTPYSRSGDGRSALGPVIREYLLSEAMHALGVPTTRALCAVRSGEQVYRETPQPGGIFTRVASSHIRIGTFEFFASRGDSEGLKALADYTIARHYPQAQSSSNPYLALIDCTAKAWANMIAKWLSLGFIHGVMNTDNMAISGETIDYGPCAFMDNFAHNRVYSFIDRHGRYAYGNQIKIGQWNLGRFASALLPIIDSDPQQAVTQTQKTLDLAYGYYDQAWLNEMSKKLGIAKPNSSDRQIIADFLNLLEKYDLDFTDSFIILSNSHEALKKYDGFADLLKRWLSRHPDFDLLKKSNPYLIPRNHQIERAIQAALSHDDTVFNQLHEYYKSPFDSRHQGKDYALPPRPQERIKNTFCGT